MQHEIPNAGAPDPELKTSPVIDALRQPVRTARHRGFEIDHAGVRAEAFELRKRLAPDIGRRHSARNGAACAFGQQHVIHGAAHIGLMNFRLARPLHDLVDPAPGHDVTAEKQPDRVHMCMRLSWRTSLGPFTLIARQAAVPRAPTRTMCAFSALAC